MDVATRSPRASQGRGYRSIFHLYYGSPGGRPWACLRREAEDERPGAAVSRRPASRGEAAVSAAPGSVVVERVDPASLDAVQPLWTALMERHAEVWGLLPCAPQTTPGQGAEAVRSWLADEGAFALVACRDGVAVGYILVDVGEGDETYVT